MRLILTSLLSLCFLTALHHAEDIPGLRTAADGLVKADEKEGIPKNRKPGDTPDCYQLATVTVFDGVDPKLFGKLKGIDEKLLSWLFSAPQDEPKAQKGGLAVALPTLMTDDPVNDRKGENIVAFGKAPVIPGCSAVQTKVKCGMMLEGHRPGRAAGFYRST